MNSPMKRVMGWMRGLVQKHVFLMITCEEFEAFMVDYFEGALPERKRLVFDLHLKMCRECRDYLAAYKRTIEVGKAAFESPQAAVPEEVPEDLVKAILATRDV